MAGSNATPTSPGAADPDHLLRKPYNRAVEHKLFKHRVAKMVHQCTMVSLCIWSISGSTKQLLTALNHYQPLLVIPLWLFVLAVVRRGHPVSVIIAPAITDDYQSSLARIVITDFCDHH